MVSTAVVDSSESSLLVMELIVASSVLGSDDAKEGPRAFAEKRKPVFEGC